MGETGEQTQEAGQTSTPSENNSDNGVQRETPSLIERADATAKRIEQALKKAEETLARNEAVLAKQMLAGRSEAGIPPKTKEQLTEDKIKASMKKYGYYS